MPAAFFNKDIEINLKDKRKISSFIDDLVFCHLNDLKKININYIFCTDEYLAEINKQYLNHDTYTDIITFDLSESSAVLLGEIYISIERVKENAEKYKTQFHDELLRVIFHGALHLCGYKDKKPSEKVEMQAMEDACIEKFKKEKI